MFAQLVSKIFNLCGHDPPTSQTDGQIDRQTTCDSKTALCTVVHRAVKIRALLIPCRLRNVGNAGTYAEPGCEPSAVANLFDILSSSSRIAKKSRTEKFNRITKRRGFEARQGIESISFGLPAGKDVT